MINKKNISARGFTLIETLMAVTLLMVAIAGPLTIASKSLQVAEIAKDQDTASYLAQDAIEYVRWARDTNKLQSTNWLTGSVNLSQCISADGSTKCYLDSIGQSPTVPTTCPGNVCSGILYDPTNNVFTYNSSNGVATVFTRTVSITNNPSGTSPNEAQVVSAVSWSDPLAHSVTVQEEIFNWQ